MESKKQIYSLISEVRKLFKDLGSWREDPCWRKESLQRFSTIINSHSTSINKAINELIKEQCDVQDQLSDMTKERDDLMATLNNLSCDHGKLNRIRYVAQSDQNPKEHHQSVTQGVEIPDTKELDAEKPTIGHQNKDQAESDVYGEMNDLSKWQHVQDPLKDLDALNDSTLKDVIDKKACVPDWEVKIVGLEGKYAVYERKHQIIAIASRLLVGYERGS